MSNILLYTFAKPQKLSYRVCHDLDLPSSDKHYLGNLQVLVSQMVTGNYKLVVGIGDYDKHASHIQIETVFANKYGRKPILAGAPDILMITWQPHLLEGMVLATQTTTGPCNRSAYLLQNEANLRHLLTRIVFVHLPGLFDFQQAIEQVTKFCRNN